MRSTEQIGVSDGTARGQTELGTVSHTPYSVTFTFTKRHHQSRKQTVVTRADVWKAGEGAV